MPCPDSGPFVLVVEPHQEGKRLDVFISTALPLLSRSAATRLIHKGQILVEGRQRKPGYLLNAGESVSGSIPALDNPTALAPEPIALDILFEDNVVILINKPPGMVVHPSPGHHHGTLVHALLHHHPEIADVGVLSTRPGIVHRLDRDTSGVLLAAKTNAAYHNLVSQFKERKIEKTYIGLVWGIVTSEEGSIVLPIGRHARDRKKMAISSAPQARGAETYWRVIERFNAFTLMEFSIKTGRTHQIRVHAASMHHPILGDALYGFKRAASHLHISRQMLHARQLKFSHPETGLPIMVSAPMPADMLEVVALFG